MQHYRGTKKSAAPTKASDMIKWIDKSGFAAESIRLPCRGAGLVKPRPRGWFRWR